MNQLSYRVLSVWFALGVTAPVAWSVIWNWPWSPAATVAGAALALLASLSAVHLVLEITRAFLNLRPLVSGLSERVVLMWGGYGLANAVLIGNSEVVIVPLAGNLVTGALGVAGLGLVVTEAVIRVQRRRLSL